MSQGSDQVISVRLRRGATSTPWGFRMQGGHEYGSPLYIQQVNPKSLSMRQGLRIGDRLLAIGSIQAHNMSHEQAKMEIIRAGNELDLIVQRNASAVIDQPDSRPQVARRNVEAYEEPTEYRGYTNPNVQSRSFKILQESLSYSEADEEGIVLPTGHTPGEGIVRKAYSEGRRRLEELSEINPRNFTADGQSPYRFTEHYLIQEQSNISPDSPDGEGRQRRQPESSSTVVASRVYDGKAVGGEARARPQVDLANSSVLSPAAGQQQYMQQAKKHYHEYYQDDYEKAIPQPQPAPVVHSQPVVRNVQQQQQQQRTDGGRPLKLVNYHFEEQYGHMRDPQAGGRQKAVVSPQKSNDFIPATQTVSSVAADLDLKIISPDAESNIAPMGQGTVVYHQQQQPAQVVTQTQTKRVRQRTRGGNTAQSSTNVVVTSVTQQAQVPATTQLDTTDGCSMSKSTATAPGPVVQAPSVQQTTVVQKRTVTQEATQQGPVVQVVAQSAPAPQAQTTQVQTTQIVAQPVPVVQEVKQTTTTVTQVEQQPGSVSEKVEQTTTVTKVVEQQSATVVQEVKQASPEKQVVEQPAPVTQEVVQEEKQAAPEAQAVEQPAPVVEEVKQAPAETQQVVEEPTPIVEEVKAPEPEPQVVEQPAPVPVQPEQPAPVPEATPVQQVAEQVSASIVQEAIEVVSTQASEQPKEETPSQPQVSETAKTEESQQVTVAVAEEKVVVEQPEAETKAEETVEVSATTSNESESVTIETTQVSEQTPAADATISVQAEDSKTKETVVVQETTTIVADTSAETVDETVSFAISTDASTEQDASESVSIALDTSANSEETITISDNSANFEISGGDAEFSLNLSSDVTISADAGNTESEETTIVLNSESTTETVDISADTAVSLSISSDVTITADEPTESATISVAQTKDESKSAEGANVTIALEETKSSESESESKTKKDKPMGQKLLEQRKNDQRNSKPAKVKIVDSQGGVAARLARLKQK